MVVIKAEAGGSATATFSPSGLLTSSATIHKAKDTSRLWLHLSPLLFDITWLAIVVLHVMCGVSLVIMGRIYVFLTNPNMIFWATLLEGAGSPYFTISSVALTTVGAIHLHQVFWILWDSVRERELVFCRKSRSISPSVQPLQSKVWSVIESQKSLKPLSKAASLLSLYVMKLFGRKGILGVESSFFPLVFVMREVVEVTSQTYQANQSCNLIPRLWINHILMALLIINCWSTPILQHFMHNHPALERAACLMLNALLNISSSFIIPLAVFLPYYRQFDLVVYSFPSNLLYNSLWYARLVTENRMLFALSFPNLIYRLINHVSIFSSIVSATTLIQRRPPCIQVAQILHTRAVHSVIASYPPTVRSNVEKQHRKIGHRYRLVHFTFFTWGFALLVVYAVAVHRSSKLIVGCRNSMTPWFTTKYPCLVFTFNCYQRHVESPIGDELAQLDRDIMAFLVYSHCPELQVPSEIQNFPNLVGFQLHNCSIRSWPLEAAISLEKHKKLVAIFLTRTNMTEFPLGLMGPLPSTVKDVEFVITNLAELPSDLGQRWSSISLLAFDYCQLQEIPVSVFQIPAILLSFVGNQIRYLPTLDDVHVSHYLVDLGDNPLQALPATLGIDSYVVYLNIEGSNITSLPPWIYVDVYMLFGLGSPYCLGLTSETPYLDGVGCMMLDPRDGGRAPMTVIDSESPL